MKKIILILVFAIVMIYKLGHIVFNMFYYDEIIEIEKAQLPSSYFENIKRNDNYDDSMFIVLNLKAKSFISGYNGNYIMENETGKYYSSNDLIIKYIYTDSIILVGSGPNTLDSGNRFFFSTPSTKMDLLRLSNLEILHSYKINRVVNSAMIVNDTCFFTYPKSGVPHFAYYLIKKVKQ